MKCRLEAEVRQRAGEKVCIRVCEKTCVVNRSTSQANEEIVAIRSLTQYFPHQTLSI
jgi:hypothetical protein